MCLKWHNYPLELIPPASLPFPRHYRTAATPAGESLKGRSGFTLATSLRVAQWRRDRETGKLVSHVLNDAWKTAGLRSLLAASRLSGRTE